MSIGSISIGHQETESSRGPWRVAAAIRRLWAAYITWRIEQAAMMALHAMSDQQLNDIGLPRSEIAAAVKGLAGRQPASGG